MSIATLCVSFRSVSLASSCIDNVTCSPTDAAYDDSRGLLGFIDMQDYFCQSGVRQSKSQTNIPHTVFPPPSSAVYRSKRVLFNVLINVLQFSSRTSLFSQSLALAIFRDQGLAGHHLYTVLVGGLILSSLHYAFPAWFGFLFAELTSQINLLVKRAYIMVSMYFRGARYCSWRSVMSENDEQTALP